MPYIDQHKRDPLDPHIKSLVDALYQEFLSDHKFKGNLNYVFTKISKDFMRKCEEQQHFGYQEIDDVSSAMRGAAVEWDRLVLGPYEDKKRVANGDV